MCDETRILLKDAKAKIEYIRLEMKRLENELYSIEENESCHDQSIYPSEQTLEQLEHHLSIETTIKKGGEKAVQLLKQTGAKKEVLAEAYQTLFQSKQRIALLEEAQRRRYQKTNDIKQNIINQTFFKAAAVTGQLQVRLDYILLYFTFSKIIFYY
jgi:hypothetical protein